MIYCFCCFALLFGLFRLVVCFPDFLNHFLCLMICNILLFLAQYNSLLFVWMLCIVRNVLNSILVGGVLLSFLFAHLFLLFRPLLKLGCLGGIFCICMYYTFEYLFFGALRLIDLDFVLMILILNLLHLWICHLFKIYFRLLFIEYKN